MFLVWVSNVKKMFDKNTVVILKYKRTRQVNHIDRENTIF